jgi:hypothetical protein
MLGDSRLDKTRRHPASIALDGHGRENTLGGKTVSEVNDQIWVVSAELIGRAEKTVKNIV